jgi:hypothetical protein
VDLKYEYEYDNKTLEQGFTQAVGTCVDFLVVLFLEASIIFEKVRVKKKEEFPLSKIKRGNCYSWFTLDKYGKISDLTFFFCKLYTKNWDKLLYNEMGMILSC